MKKLLTTNSKLNKESGYSVVGLALAPASHSGKNVCPESTASCRAACCLWMRGMTVQPQVRKAMIRRTKSFFDDRPSFLSKIHQELKTHSKRKSPACRLNVASDLPFYKIDPTLYTSHPNIKHYEYTKVRSKMDAYINGELPDNIHVTYSWNEKSDKRQVNRWLKKGGNVAMVLDVYYVPGKPMGDLPKTIKIGTKMWPVVDGDIQDVRLPETDGRGVIVGLRAKVKNSLKQKFIDSGFIVASPWKI